MSKQQIYLIHWNVAEAKERAGRIRAAGYRVFCPAFTLDEFKQIKRQPPAAVVIDLSRLPAQGRDGALAFRQAKATRGVPLVFVGGADEKVARFKQQLPDAEYTDWARIRSALKRAIANPPTAPVVPSSPMDGYSGTPLPKKLGIKANVVVALVNAPDGFADLLEPLPEGITLRFHSRGRRDLTIWFAKSLHDLQKRIGRLADQVEDGGLWIAWKKKASGSATDLTQINVRKIGLASGLVDYKICSIDETWSALKFARRKGN